MLDRTTKDIDASIELLEDRRKQYKILSKLSLFVLLIYIIIILVVVVISAITTDELVAANPKITFSVTLATIFLTGIMVAVWTLSDRCNDKEDYLSLLLYLKQHERKK